MKQLVRISKEMDRNGLLGLSYVFKDVEDYERKSISGESGLLDLTARLWYRKETSRKHYRRDDGDAYLRDSHYGPITMARWAYYRGAQYRCCASRSSGRVSVITRYFTVHD